MSTRSRRRIERVRCTLDHQVPASNTSIVLHEAEDTKTLIRMLMDLAFYTDSTAQDYETISAVISVAPRSISVVENSIGEDLDNDVPLEEITRIYTRIGNNLNAASGFSMGKDFYRDIKAMRKLRPGDTIEWADIATTVSKCSVEGIIYLWFKE